jgi:hypothetical protein
MSHISATPKPLPPSRLLRGCRFIIPHVDLSPLQIVNSLLTLQLNEASQITRHTEEWDHNRETTADDGFLGMLNEHRKRMTAALTNLFISKP